jgi:hypothetical protein
LPLIAVYRDYYSFGAAARTNKNRSLGAAAKLLQDLWKALTRFDNAKGLRRHYGSHRNSLALRSGNKYQ